MIRAIMYILACIALWIATILYPQSVPFDAWPSVLMVSAIASWCYMAWVAAAYMRNARARARIIDNAMRQINE